MAEQARKLCLLGATDEDLARFFEVAVDTINEWKKRHKEFSASIKDGKETADAEVAHSLNERARGYRYIEQQAIKVKEVQYENGKRVSEIEHVEIVPTERVVPPDSTAAIFWLKNRKKKLWRDRHELTGEDGKAISQLVVIRSQVQSSQTDNKDATVSPNGEQ